MSYHTFTSGLSSGKIQLEERTLELLCIIGLLLASLILYTIHLGSLPLRDWDEATVAQVAKEIYQSPFLDLKWLFPTIWGEPYVNKPPLIHGLIAIVYSIFGINEFSTRIVGASLSAFAVPLLYCVARELFLPRYYALFSALVYLTTFPVVRHGRLAMLDGAVICFSLFMFLCLLKSRRNVRWSLGIGIGFGLICLSKGWMLGILMGSIGFMFLLWDTPRLLTSIYLWFGLLVGSLPVIFWQISHFLNLDKNLVNIAIFDQSLERIYTPVEGHAGPFWYYLLELLKYPHPWLFISFFGLFSAWRHRNWSWGKFIITWSCIYLGIVSVMFTKLPWYIMPIYPALALAAGVALAEVKSLPNDYPYPASWTKFFYFLSSAIAIGIIYFAYIEKNNYPLLVILGLIGITMLITAIMISKRDQQFMIVLFWGMYVSLLLLFSSDYWLWELNESFEVKPVATLVKHHVPKNQKVYTSFDYERPSLNFYSEHKILPLNSVIGKDKQWKSLTEFWQDNNNNLLVNNTNQAEILKELNLMQIPCNKDIEKETTLPNDNLHTIKLLPKQGEGVECFTSKSASDWLLLIH